ASISRRPGVSTEPGRAVRIQQLAVSAGSGGEHPEGGPDDGHEEGADDEPRIEPGRRDEHNRRDEQNAYEHQPEDECARHSAVAASNREDREDRRGQAVPSTSRPRSGTQPSFGAG